MKNSAALRRNIFDREEKVLRTFLTGGLLPTIIGWELNRPRGSPAERPVLGEQTPLE
ncbi:MAG: hypothetical protein LBG07_03730 [Treponema sp.]|nr:hypothetical protein [Treponema sp.]